MPLSVYLTFVGASVGLVLLPGPNVALILATSLTRGVGPPVSRPCSARRSPWCCN